MDFKEYQGQASKTAIYDQKHSILYPALGLVSEAGEVAGKIKKVYRDENGNFHPENRQQIAEEVGDVLWYIAALCTDLGIPMDVCAKSNLNKLNSRSNRGVLGGSGDYR